MIERLRRAFNDTWNESAYEALKARLVAEAGCPITFRVCETPVFLPAELREAMVTGAGEIWAELSRPDRLEFSKAAVPPGFDVPGSDAHPLFAQADFAIATDHGRLVPRLIELQGFPSLYGFQFVQNRILRDRLRPGEDLEFLFSGLGEDEYLATVGEAILGGLPAAHVVLLDLDPPRQGTYPDFTVTEKLFGVRPIGPGEITKRGRELWYDRDGKATRILRIYNRVIVDELVATGLTLPFDLREELDVQWAGHPNWFFRWSKHSLPGLRHPLVPEARLLSDLDRIPSDLENWVLKPLFSFSGSGVQVEVTRADVERVPAAERTRTMLMRKVEYAPAIESPRGERSRVEIRIMFVWHAGRLRPTTTLARLSQGPMMGVKYNKDKTWVGSTGCLWPRD
ncbi:MAG TPA: hypothetical protein VMV21_04900 [Vicinamibacteria bacterium]|nr:hypothetical protein [Vicinamibacteria bacterium]